MRSYFLLSFLVAGCAASATGSTDAGTMGTPDVTHPKDVTSGMDVQVNRDVISIFSDTSMPTSDATVDAPSKNDVVTPAEGGSHTDGASDAGKDGESADALAHDSGGTDSEAKDTGTKDSGFTCMPVTVPSSTSGLTMCTPSTTCPSPGNTSSFTPTAASPATPATNTCKAGQLTGLYNGCLGDTSTNTTCTNAANVNQACYNCVFMNAGSTNGTSWGPIVSGTGTNALANLNVGGCLQLLEPCNAACAQTFIDNLECQLAACQTNCSVADGTSAEIMAFGTCAQNADNCLPPSCGKFGVGTECANSITGPDHPGSVCFADPNFDLMSFVTVAALFCGGS